MAHSKVIQRRIVQKSMKDLIKQIENALKEKKFENARRWYYILRQYSKKYLIKIPKNLKRSFCKNCYSPLIPGITARIRIKNGRKVITCLGCGKVYRYPYKNNKDEKKV